LEVSKRGTVISTAVVAILSLASLALADRRLRGTGAPSAGEEFYIISTVDLAKKQMVLKKPTEVTVLMLVPDKTTLTNLEGKRIQLKDLRAGDTVYVRAAPDSQGRLVASSIRIGIMTERELYEHYLKGIPITPAKD
jgi:hypothetical protein